MLPTDWKRNVTISRFDGPIPVSNIDLGNFYVSNVTVSNVVGRVPVSGNVSVEEPYYFENAIVASSVAGQVSVYGNVGLSGGDFVPSEISVLSVETPMSVYGVLGVEDGAILGNVVLESVETPIEVVGNVWFVPGASIGNVVVESVESVVRARGGVDITTGGRAWKIFANVPFDPAVEGNIGIANCVLSNVRVSSIVAPVLVYGNVDVTGPSGEGAVEVSNVYVSSLSNPANVFGLIGAKNGVYIKSVGSIANVYGNVVSNASIYVRNVTSPVTVFGNVSLVSNVVVKSVTNVVRMIANAAVIGNTSLYSIESQVRVTGNVLVPNGIALSNVLTPINVYPVSPVTGAISASKYEDASGRLDFSTQKALIGVRRVCRVPDYTAVVGNTANCSESHDSTTSVTSITSGQGGAGSIVRRSRLRAIHQSGSSLFAMQHFKFQQNLGLAVQNVGYFDGNNGVFLRLDNTRVPAFVYRSNASGTVDEEVVYRPYWNLDALDGTGPSSFSANVTSSSMIVAFDIAEPFVGRIRCGFRVGNRFLKAHEFCRTGPSVPTLPYGVSFMGNHSLPLRWESSSYTNSAASLDASGGTVFVEGSTSESFVERTYAPSSNVALVGTGVEVLAMRVKRTYSERARIRVVRLEFPTVGSLYGWRLRVNPTATSQGTWTSSGAGSGSVAEFNSTRTVSLSSTPVLASGYTHYVAFDSASTEAGIIELGEDGYGNPDVLSLEVFGFTGALNFRLTFREVY